MKLCAVSQNAYNLIIAQDLDSMFDIYAYEKDTITSFSQGIIPQTA